MININDQPVRRPPMMGQRRFEQKLYYQLSLDALVPPDHLLRRIAAIVDFSFVRALCRPYYSHTGQPSVDPVVIFKMLLVGYLYGITSERRLAEEVRLHLAYRWFLGYDLDDPTPNHSVLSKARARLGTEVFEQFFQQSIALCGQAGLLEAGPVYVDSTLLRANAAVKSLKPRLEVVRPPYSVSEYLERLDEDDDAEDDADPPSDRGTRPRRPTKSVAALRPNQIRQSRTDPEATLVDRPEFGRHLAYKAHVAVSGRGGQVITAAIATTGATADERMLAAVLWQHRRLSRLPVPAVVADAKYGVGDNFLWLDHEGIPAFIPVTRFGNQHTGIWGVDHFLWLPEEEAFLCPAGHRLRRHQNHTRTRRVRYRAPKGVCLACPYRARCAPSGIERTVHRSWAADLVEAAQARMASREGKRRRRERQTRIEGVFGLGKEVHGLRRTRFRRRWRVQIQLWLTAAAMNIKKAVQKQTGKRPWAAAAAACTRRDLAARFVAHFLSSLSAALSNRPTGWCHIGAVRRRDWATEIPAHNDLFRLQWLRLSDDHSVASSSV
jgi:transposase